MTLGARIRTARQAAGLSQSRLAELMGVTRSACSQWEADTGTAPRRQRLERLARLLGVSYSWLATGAEEAHTALREEPALYLNEEQRELLRLYQQLSPPRRRALLAFLRAC
jgi:transcriptional regulator with XRE-family HTH domain